MSYKQNTRGETSGVFYLNFNHRPEFQPANNGGLGQLKLFNQQHLIS